jgi:hypothetical protein
MTDQDFWRDNFHGKREKGMVFSAAYSSIHNVFWTRKCTSFGIYFRRMRDTLSSAVSTAIATISLHSAALQDKAQRLIWLSER